MNVVSEQDFRQVIIETEPVELCKILKFENLVLSGGEAKHVIAEGMVWVNGELELRKRRKIYAGDVISYNGEQMRIVTPSGKTR